MKYLKLFESFFNKKFEDKPSKIHEICKKYYIENYTINNDGSIDVDSNVDFFQKNLTKLPIKFNKVSRGFTLSYNKLTSLEGSPVEVDEDFYCSSNKLTSFKYAPKIIRGNLGCSYNNIKTFEYFPNYVAGYLYCSGNPIYEVWKLFGDTRKIELLNDFDMFRDEETDRPCIVMDRLNDFLLTIGEYSVGSIDQYKNIY